MSNYSDFLTFLNQDFENDNKLKPQQLKAALEKISSQLHANLDKAKDNLITYGIKAFEKEEKDKTDIKIPEQNSKDDIKLKIHQLVESLDLMLKRTEYLDDSIKQVQEDPIDKLLYVNRKNNELEFRQTKKFQLKVEGKVNIDLGWKSVQNKSYSTVDSKDPSKLNIFGNSCYNYYQTDKEFVDEDVEIVLLTNAYQVNDYFYFGVRNETTDPNNNCMCCSPSSVTYMKSSGNVYEKGNNKTENLLNYQNSSRKEIKIKIRLSLSDPSNKCVYFEVDEKGECGPYSLGGSKFTVTSGSCNECNGYIKIDSAYHI